LQVMRGSLLAIPIEQSLLYIQPLYLAAGQSALPELKRVIVGYGNQLAMEETLEASLEQIFRGGEGPAVAPSGPIAPRAPPPGDGSARGLAEQAWQQYTRAQDFLRQGNFAGYGEEVERLEHTLKALQGLAN
jgi:uncharacterized protein